MYRVPPTTAGEDQICPPVGVDHLTWSPPTLDLLRMCSDGLMPERSAVLWNWGQLADAAAWPTNRPGPAEAGATKVATRPEHAAAIAMSLRSRVRPAGALMGVRERSLPPSRAVTPFEVGNLGWEGPFGRALAERHQAQPTGHWSPAFVGDLERHALADPQGSHVGSFRRGPVDEDLGAVVLQERTCSSLLVVVLDRSLRHRRDPIVQARSARLRSLTGKPISRHAVRVRPGRFAARTRAMSYGRSRSKASSERAISSNRTRARRAAHRCFANDAGPKRGGMTAGGCRRSRFVPPSEAAGAATTDASWANAAASASPVMNGRSASTTARLPARPGVSRSI